MKIIKKGQDFKYHVLIFDKDTGEEIQIISQNYYKVQIYTNDSRTWIDATSYIDASNMLQVDTQILRPLSSGQIHIKIMFSEANSVFQDKNYDYMNIISTDSYYDSEDMIDNLLTVQWGQIFGDITKQEDLIDFIKNIMDDKSIIGISQNEYEHLKANNQLKENALYVITDDNEDGHLEVNNQLKENILYVSIDKNEYEHLKSNNQLKENILYVITDDNEDEHLIVNNQLKENRLYVITDENEYEYLKSNNQLKENTLYVITDDNERLFLN